MDFQALTSLLAALVTLAIGASVLLRDARRKTYATFAVFTVTVALFHIFTFAAHATDLDTLRWLALFPAAFIPTNAMRFFGALLAEQASGGRRRASTVTYLWTALACGALVYGGVVEPIHEQRWFLIPFTAYVFGGLYLGAFQLYAQYRATVGRVEKARLRYLTIGGFLAITVALSDYVPRGTLSVPAIGNLLTVLYLYFLSQTLFRHRLLDLHELVAKMGVLGTLVLLLSVVYGLLLSWVGGGRLQGIFLLNTVVAAFVILILFEPIRGILENEINRWLVRERGELRPRMEHLRRELQNVIDAREMVRRVLAAIEESRRVTHASIYLVDGDGSAFELAGHIGPPPADQIDVAARRPFFDRLRGGVVLLEAVERERHTLEEGQAEAAQKEIETLDAIARTMSELHASMALPIHGSAAGRGSDRGPADDVLAGVFCLRDDRVKDAYLMDDVDIFRQVAAQAAVIVENSQVYERMKERDRLAALGEMAAGLAHEIRNPLGAIKGAAQLLVGPDGRLLPDAQHETSEFLGIIVEEVNRLNRVVTQFLDYARPYKGEPVEVDVNDVVRRTVQLLEAEQAAAGVTFEVQLAAEVPCVRGDAEQLRQVFLNLGLNALQAMPPDDGEHTRRLRVVTGRRSGRRRGDWSALVEVRFADTGRGIAREHLPNLFIPFFTTKDKGTGLGLPISQRIITHHGGVIEVRSEPGEGATFSVLLPVFEQTSVTATGSILQRDD
ncbi:MAG: sensor histidine kinase [Myxococcales bacterium]|nr:sensor histidine kinase [Myxococcales bacterium]